MTKISIINENGLHSITADGHAEGSETLCAAISTIMQMLVGWLNNAEEHLKETAVTLISDGYCKVIAKGDACLDAVFEAAEIGLRMLELTDPNKIKVFLSK